MGRRRRWKREAACRRIRSWWSGCARFAARGPWRWSSEGGGQVKDTRERRKLARKRLRRLQAMARQRRADEERRKKEIAPGATGILAEGAKPSRTKPATAAHAEKEEQRQLEIEALERDVSELGRLTDPADATAPDVNRLRREIEE